MSSNFTPTQQLPAAPPAPPAGKPGQQTLVIVLVVALIATLGAIAFLLGSGGGESGTTADPAEQVSIDANDTDTNTEVPSADEPAIVSGDVANAEVDVDATTAGSDATAAAPTTADNQDPAPDTSVANPTPPAPEAPANDAPVNDTPVNDAPVNDAPVSDTPGHDAAEPETGHDNPVNDDHDPIVGDDAAEEPVCDLSTHDLVDGERCQPKCPEGKHRSTFDACYCSGNTEEDPDDWTKCVEIDDSPPTCATGEELVGTDCRPVCGPFESRNSAGACEQEELTIQIRCQQGQEFINGACVFECIGGDTRNADGVCEWNVQPFVCPDGEVPVGEDCKPKCGPLQTRNDAGNCELIELKTTNPVDTDLFENNVLDNNPLGPDQDDDNDTDNALDNRLGNIAPNAGLLDNPLADARIGK